MAEIQGLKDVKMVNTGGALLTVAIGPIWTKTASAEGNGNVRNPVHHNDFAAARAGRVDRRVATGGDFGALGLLRNRGVLRNAAKRLGGVFLR